MIYYLNVAPTLGGNLGYKLSGTQNSVAIGVDIKPGGHVSRPNFTNSTGICRNGLSFQKLPVISSKAIFILNLQYHVYSLLLNPGATRKSNALPWMDCFIMR